MRPTDRPQSAVKDSCRNTPRIISSTKLYHIIDKAAEREALADHEELPNADFREAGPIACMACVSHVVENAKQDCVVVARKFVAEVLPPRSARSR